MLWPNLIIPIKTVFILSVITLPGDSLLAAGVGHILLHADIVPPVRGSVRTLWNYRMLLEELINIY